MAQVQKLLAYQIAPADAATYTYYKFLDPVPGYGAITTSGSSTTVTYLSTSALDAYKHPFNDFSVGTIFNVTTGAGTVNDLNRVTAVASDQSITIASAKDYSTPTSAWTYQKLQSGTSATSGWLVVNNFRTKLVKVVVTALGSTSITARIESKLFNLDAAPAEVYTIPTITTASGLGAVATVQIPETAGAIRVGLIAPGGPNAADRVNVFFIGEYGAYESAN